MKMRPTRRKTVSFWGLTKNGKNKAYQNILIGESYTYLSFIC